VFACSHLSAQSDIELEYKAVLFFYTLFYDVGVNRFFFFKETLK